MFPSFFALSPLCLFLYSLFPPLQSRQLLLGEANVGPAPVLSTLNPCQRGLNQYFFPLLRIQQSQIIIIDIVILTGRDVIIVAVVLRVTRRTTPLRSSPPAVTQVRTREVEGIAREARAAPRSQSNTLRIRVVVLVRF